MVQKLLFLTNYGYPIMFFKTSAIKRRGVNILGLLINVFWVLYHKFALLFPLRDLYI